MEMNNLFLEGKTVTGDSFIGREECLTELIDKWIDCRGNASYSITGLNRMGKSSLVCQFMDMVKKKDPTAICVNVTLGGYTFPKLVQKISKQILAKKIALSEEIQVVLKKISSMQICDNSCDCVDNFECVLDEMSETNQKFLLVIEEFDGARKYWNDKREYFEQLRDMAQKNIFIIIVSRRPLKVIETESWGQSCFHNVFTEMNIRPFNESDMNAYYGLLKDKYDIELREREKVDIEEYTGFCPAFLASVGYRLAYDRIHGKPRRSVENICTDKDFYMNCLNHYTEFLTRMQEDGMWNDVVRVLFDISPTLIEKAGDKGLDRTRIEMMKTKGYLRVKKECTQDEPDRYIIISDDFMGWAQNYVYDNLDSTIYKNIITAEIAIREILRAEMSVIWESQFRHQNWEEDLLNQKNVPREIEYFVVRRKRDFESCLRKAQRHTPGATVVDALPMKVKLLLIKIFWRDGIKRRFGDTKYQEWENDFKTLEKIRDPLFHANLDLTNPTIETYCLLNTANASANRIIEQLSKKNTSN